MIIRGKATRLGDDIDTDQIYPGRYLPITDLSEMAKHALEGVPGLKDVSDIIIAGRNFGCGSSREHAPIALKVAGVKLVIAKTFAPIFYRNSVNIALPILKFEDVYEIADTDEVEVDLRSGMIKDLTKDWQKQTSSLSGLELEIFAAGGLLNYLKKT